MASRRFLIGIGRVAGVIVAIAAFGTGLLSQEPPPNSPTAQGTGSAHAGFPWRRKEDRPGLLAQLEHADGRIEYAVDSAPWYLPSTTPRAKKITWAGTITADDEGQYQFAAEFCGRLVWKLGRKVLILETVDALTVRVSVPIELGSGWHETTIEFTPRNERGSLRTYWTGPKFLPEPLPEKALNFGFIYDFPEITKAELIGDVYFPWRRGKELYEQSRCGACHELPGVAAPNLVSDLGAAGKYLDSKWVAGHLTEATRSARRQMPAFAIGDGEAAEIANAICTGVTTKEHAAPDAAQVAKGEVLFTSTGCFACHAWKDIGEGRRSFGGELTRVGDKWNRGFFAKWLADPKSVQPLARMPKPDLNAEETVALAEFLSKSRSEATDAAIAPSGSGNAKKLADKHRCAACHVMPESLSAPGESITKLAFQEKWDDSCLGTATSAHPGYGFSGDESKSLKQYISSRVRKTLFSTYVAHEPTPLERHGCTECHAREMSGGLRAKLVEAAAEAPERFADLGLMLPPSLHGAGDKLEEKALRESIGRDEKTKAQRPWLGVRMPHYSLSPDEMKAIVEQIVWEDRVPDSVVRLLTKPKVEAPGDAEMKSAGARLVTTDGFSCTSCHDVGKWKASPAKPGARGTDLAMCGERIRESWFYRWLRNPARISPNMEMPSVQVAVKGVLGGDLDLQSQALWKVMNERGFTPPSSGALRVLAGDPGGRQPTAYLMDVVVADGKTYIKPLVIAFPNQVNLLWDMEENRLARFWIGPAARQYTRGKSWYWQLEGTSLLGLHESQASEILLEVDGKAIDCARVGQFKTDVDHFEVRADSISVGHRLTYELPGGGRQVLRVTQRFSPVAASGSAGVERVISVDGVRAGQSVKIAIRDQAMKREGVEDRIEVLNAGESGATIRYLTNEAAPEAVGRSAGVMTEASEADSRLVPGFSTRRLLLPAEIMPTAIAWRPDGKMGVASLRGRVWEVRDRDRDGLEDDARPFTDELAAPYGLAGNADGYDVLAKGGLYRASDLDRDGVAEELKLLASGWGHTDDYHDWVVGLPSDGAGGYYVAVPCQQDDRSAEAAKFRGKLLHLAPRAGTPDDPREFEISVVSSGHRFPMGLARRAADGELFVTDNQGNYNPFNELNHVAGGRFFGFVNQIEKKAKAPVPALTAPAIDLPHPWTRSVNGICFLEGRGGKTFGPLEGHLVGCEYDTRRLVRMTLQKVGDSFQGAVYPLSREGAAGGLSFLGPVSCAVSPRGELYVGSMKDSGWGAGNNVGEVFQLKFAAERLPAGILEVTARNERQLVIQFHGAIDAGAAREARNYRIESYTRVSTPAYGGEDVQRRSEAISSVEFDEASGCATLTLEKLRTGFVYEIHVDKSVAGGKDFFPAEAHFSFRRAP